MTLQERLTAPTPRFFKRIKKAGLLVAGTGTTLLAAPVALPPVWVNVAAYLVVAGGVAAAVSQAAVDLKQIKTGEDGKPACMR